MRLFALAVLFACAYLLPAHAAPGFKCSAANLGADETAICASPTLSTLDREINFAYRALKADEGQGAADAIGIPGWRARQGCGADRACIERRQREELAAFAAHGVALGPSFDCAKASQPDELAICGSPRLAELDRRVADAYNRIYETEGLAAADAIGRPYWLRRGACQADAACIRDTLTQEVAQLKSRFEPDAPREQAALATPTPTPALLVTPAPATGGCKGSNRVALVIGEAAYPEPSTLTNPANDADDVARLLQDRLCFHVMLAKNAGFDALSETLGAFAQAAEGADVALFYFSGHGMQYRQVNYLLPIDVKLTDEYQLVHRSLSAQDIVGLLEARAKVALVFLDACRTDPLEEEFRRRMSGAGRDLGSSRGLAPLDAHGETMIVYATRPNATAADGVDRNSPFTRAFLELIATPGKDVELVLRDVATRVVDLTHGAQVPQRLTELRHGLVLLPPL